MTYLHNTPPSALSRFLQFSMSVLGMKTTIGKLLKNKKFAHKAANIPAALQRICNITSTEIEGRTVWTLQPKKVKSPTKTILYLHGGAYISGIVYLHWDFVKTLVEQTNATVVVPDYPLAPNANYAHTFSFLQKLYNDLLTQNDPQNLIFMGDSAGAGLAFAFAQFLQKQEQPQPEQLILLSPWLDITMQNPELAAVDSLDKMLDIKNLQAAGALYANDLDTKDYRLSPIYGDFSGLGKISVFIGTHDLFIADCRKLKNLLDTKNIAFNYFEYPTMFHVWMLVTLLPEAKVTLAQISELVHKS
jgi:acetyl esterase/lipase